MFVLTAECNVNSTRLGLASPPARLKRRGSGACSRRCVHAARFASRPHRAFDVGALAGRGAGRRGARQPLRRPGGDGADARRRGRILLGARARARASFSPPPIACGRFATWRSTIATPRARQSSFRSTRRSRIRNTAPTPFRLASRSIDVALISTARPLDARFVGAAFGTAKRRRSAARASCPAMARRARATGHRAASCAVTLAVREPASPVLVWAADPGGRVAGACNGDSGAPIWSADGDRHRDRRLGPGAPRPRLRRAHPRTHARAAKILD